MHNVLWYELVSISRDNTKTILRCIQSDLYEINFSYFKRVVQVTMSAWESKFTDVSLIEWECLRINDVMKENNLSVSKIRMRLKEMTFLRTR